jgi:hypothetical protein
MNRRRVLCTGAGLAAVVLGLTPPAFAQKGEEDGEFVILQARYGTARHHVDVTERLRTIARNDRRVRMTQALMGVDPAPGRDKVLRIYARDRHGRERRFEYPERAWIEGSQFEGWSTATWGDPRWRGGSLGTPHRDHDEEGQYTILYASYGTPSGREINVTSRLRGLARRSQRFRLASDTFGIDTQPDPGPKRLLIVALDTRDTRDARDTRDGPRSFEYSEGSWVDGTPFVGWSGGEWGDGARHGDSSGLRPDDTPGRDDGEFTILSATYGTPRREIDVTARLRALAQRDAKFQLGGTLFGVDAVPGGVRLLRIHARDRNGAERSFAYRDGAWVDGLQFVGWGASSAARAGRLWIDSASYGSEGRWVDVTRTLRERAQGDRFNTVVGDALCGHDPAPGRRKTLRVSYRVGSGPTQTVEVAERDPLRLP